MPNQKPTGAGTPPKQTQKLPSVRADVYWLNPDEDSTIRANASLTIGGAFKVHGIKVISGSKGDFVSMPSYKSGDGYKDIFHAVTADARQQMNDAVLAAYEQKLAEQTQDAPTEEQDMTEPDEPAEAEEGAGMTMQ